MAKQQQRKQNWERNRKLWVKKSIKVLDKVVIDKYDGNLGAFLEM